MSGIVFISGEIVDLCVLEKKRHLDKVVEWENDQTVNNFLEFGGIFPVSKYNREEWLEEQEREEKEVNFAIETKENNDFVGIIGLHQINWLSRTAISKVVIGNREEWGKHYATDAGKLLVNYGFRHLNLHKIYTYIIAENKGSLKAAKNAGYTEEAILKDHVFKNGSYRNVAVYSIFQQ